MNKHEPRYYHNRILELIEEGLYTYKSILEELLCYLDTDTIEDFFKTAYGNEGLEPTEEEEEDNDD